MACREQYGIPALVKLLEAMPFDAVTAAAADALRALAMNNEANKTAIREAWAVPLLVKLLGSEVGCNHAPAPTPPHPRPQPHPLGAVPAPFALLPICWSHPLRSSLYTTTPRPLKYHRAFRLPDTSAMLTCPLLQPRLDQAFGACAIVSTTCCMLADVGSSYANFLFA